MKLTDIHSPKDLPTDVSQLQSLLWSTICEIRTLNDSYQLLRKELFGRKSERQTIDSAQVVLEGILQQVPEQPVQQSKEEGFVDIKPHQRRRKHPGRNVIPENVKRERHILDIPEDERTCKGCSRKDACGRSELPILEKVVRQVVERKRPEYIVHEYVRVKRACPLKKDEVKVVEPPLVTPIPKGLAGLSLLLFVALSKYQYHLPLYRIQRIIFHESRIWFTRATMVGWIAELCVLLKRVYRAMVASVKSSPVIYSDDSLVRRITQESGSHTSYMWVYVGAEGRIAIFDYRETRASSAPREFLTGVAPGTHLMIDGCPSYNKAITKHQLIPMICMMHIRREFVEAAEVGSGKDFALRIIALIGQLYALERTANDEDLGTQQRQQLRATYSAPIMAQIKNQLMNPDIIVLPSSRIGRAINYALNHWSRAELFLARGDLPLDNGACERVIRDLAIGRKNWLAVGSDEGGKRMAMLYSVIATCKLNGIDVEDYFADALMRLAIRPPENDVSDLTPIEWFKERNGGVLPPLQPIYPSDN